MSANVTVTVASGDALDVRDFNVDERISDLFAIRLTALSDNADIDFEAVVGKEASFSLYWRGMGDKPRTWTGICCELDQIRVETTGVSTYHLVIAPTFWLATQRRNHRMFQRKTELEIVTQMLGEWGVAFEEKITQAYKSRKYRVQYGETDYEFISRMLEDAGISFYFEGESGTSRLVLSDAPQSNDARVPPIAFRDTPTVADKEHVTAVSIGRRVRPGKYTMRDVDYRRPASYPLLTTATDAAGIEAKLERFHYTPGAFLYESDKGGGDTPQADDRGTHRADEGEGKKLADKRLAAKRGDAITASFVTNVADLAPGTVMSILDYPNRALGDGKSLLVTDARIDGSRNAEYACHVVVRSADQPFHPEMRTPKPKVMGVESATVVGPVGEEIHVDELGRVRVSFHWDRESKMDETSSCWIPVSHPWAGAGYGATNLPRIGQEVLVDFLGGDPDRPMVVGRVYTNLQKTPYKLPANKTQSGWKSNTSPTNGGYNEIMFEDAAGKELVRIQAEKDLSGLVKHDESWVVGHDRSRLVRRNEDVTIGKNRSRQVVQNERVMIGQNQTITVGVNRSVQVGAVDSLTVGTTHVVRIAPPGPPAPNMTVTMSDKKMVLDTGGGANITLENDKITLTANTISISGKAGTELTSKGTTAVSGVPVELNGPGLFCGRVTELAPDTIQTGAALVLVGGASFPFKVVKQPDGSLKVGDHIIVKPGDGRYPDFQNKVMRDLGIMSTTPTGMQRLNNIENNPGGKDLTIREYSADDAKKYGENNSYENATGAGGDLTYDKDGNPIRGAGSSTEIAYNPDIVDGPPGAREPADATLFHEMGHADHDMYGVDRGNEPMGGGWDNREEWQNIQGGVNEGPGGTQVPGVPPSPTENQYLGDRGYPYVRTNHGDGYSLPDGSPIPGH